MHVQQRWEVVVKNVIVSFCNVILTGVLQRVWSRISFLLFSFWPGSISFHFNQRTTNPKCPALILDWLTLVRYGWRKFNAWILTSQDWLMLQRGWIKLFWREDLIGKAMFCQNLQLIFGRNSSWRACYEMSFLRIRSDITFKFMAHSSTQSQHITSSSFVLIS